MTTLAPERIGYLEGADAETFDLNAYLAGFDERLLETREGRRIATRLDPLLWALLYVPHHLRGTETGDRITFADFHLALFRHARSWVCANDTPARDRDAWVAPRSAGKSTLLFLVLPLWAACHRHARFIAAFADSGPQAEQHLSTFRTELETNALLRADFPDLCAPARRPAGTAVSDNRTQIQQQSGFVFTARGVDSGVLGMKVGDRRPDLLILDDLEPHEGVYSAYQAKKRLGTMLDAILPLNTFARVVLTGTVVMSGSIVHQLVRTVTEPAADHPEWIAAENWKVHHFAPILARPDGTRRSCWPAKWSLEFLESIEHTRSYAKNFRNEPVSEDGDYWSPTDFVYADAPCARTLLSIDPSATSKTTSDPYGISIVGHAPALGRCVVRYAHAARMAPAELRTTVLGLLERFPEVGAVLVESNVGGEAWAAILHDLPVRLATVHQTDPKDTRAARLLNHYQRLRPDGLPEVVHARPLPALETEMCGFPRGLHDDLVDSVGQAVYALLDRKKPARASARAAVYA